MLIWASWYLKSPVIRLFVQQFALLQEQQNTQGPSYSQTGPRLNIKTVLSTNGDFHVKDKTAARTSYL